MNTNERLPSLGELEKWARDPSGESWNQLLRGLTDLFLSDAAAHMERNGEAYSEIVCRLLDQVAAEVRADLSKRVAPLQEFPDRVVRRLAEDEETIVSAPVLEHSPVLAEEDLLEIIGMMVPDKSLAISKRRQLGHKITDILVKQGDEQVLRTMASNPGAAFSPKTYRQVAERAKRDPDLQTSLVDRADLTQAVAVQITPFLSDELKARLRALEEPEGGSLLDSLSEVTAEKAGSEISRKDKVEAYTAVELVRAGNASLNDTAAKLASAGKLGVLCRFLAGVAKIPDKTVTAAFSNQNGTALAIICKGLKLSPAAFTAVAQLRARRLGVSSSESIRYIDGYGKLSATESEKALKAMQDKEARPAA